MRIIHHSFEEPLDRFHRSHGLVAMPLEVGSLPIDFPHFLGSDVSRLRDGMLENHRLVPPAWRITASLRDKCSLPINNPDGIKVSKY